MPTNKEPSSTRRAELERCRGEALAAARARAEKLNGATVRIARKLSEQRQLFGSVGIKEFRRGHARAGFEVAKSELHLPPVPVQGHRRS